MGEEVSAPLGSDAVAEVENHFPPITFSIGAGEAPKKVKKGAKKPRQVVPRTVAQPANGMEFCKRKSSWLESEMDGDDTRMDEMDIHGKKQKLSSDIFDGNLCSLTVAEVGQHQPREDQ